MTPTRGTRAPGAALRRRLRAARGDSGVGRRPANVAGTGGRAAGRAGGPGGGRFRADRGMTAIEFVFLTPVLFFMIFATVQFGLYFFAEHVAQAAAQAGARKARDNADADPGGWSGLASDTASSYIRQLGPSLLVGPHVHPYMTADQATVGVQVTAQVPAVFPGLHFSVRETSQGPVERFVPDGPGDAP